MKFLETPKKCSKGCTHPIVVLKDLVVRPPKVDHLFKRVLPPVHAGSYLVGDVLPVHGRLCLFVLWGSITNTRLLTGGCTRLLTIPANGTKRPGTTTPTIKTLKTTEQRRTRLKTAFKGETVTKMSYLVMTLPLTVITHRQKL